MSRSAASSKNLSDIGASVSVVNAFDQFEVEQALRRSQAEVVIDQLTALPKDPSQLSAAFPGDRKLRLEGGGNLHRAAQAVGVRRYIQQASGFFLKAASGLADESSPLVTDGSAGVATSARCTPKLNRDSFTRGKWKGSPFVMDSFMVRERGIPRKGPLRSRSGGSKCLLLEEGQGSGLGYTSRTRLSPPSRL
jgi:hypothetical protein